MLYSYLILSLNDRVQTRVNEIHCSLWHHFHHYPAQVEGFKQQRCAICVRHSFHTLANDTYL